jgi:imidazolonepropionase-like amidohydrolase
MPPAVAIRTATVNAAKMLGLESELGTIEAGKQADIVATGRNPLDDIGAMLDVRFVMRNGKVFRNDGSATAARPAGSSP